MNDLDTLMIALDVNPNLLHTKVPAFDGSATKLVTFINKFRDVMHQQQCLNNTERCMHLLQHAVSGYTCDACGYVDKVPVRTEVENSSSHHSHGYTGRQAAAISMITRLLSDHIVY